MSVTKELFFTLPDGTPVHRYTLANARVSFSVLDRGATLQRVALQGPSGKPVEVLLHYDEPAAVLTCPDYLGAFVGRVANRIAGGRFTLDGKEYQLACNDGANHLHGGVDGFDKRMFRLARAEDDLLELALTSPDGDQGYPGKLDLTVRWTLLEDGFSLEWEAAADKPTPAAFTCHAYWNLAGRDAGPDAMLAHRLRIFAHRYTPVDEGLIPTGELAKVEGTPFDFTDFHPIGERIGQDCPQLALAGGYDHNFALDEAAGPDGLRPLAQVMSPATGVAMSIDTTLPGVQFYSGNGMQGHPRRSGFCLEPQTFPDAVNQPAFGQDVILRPGETRRDAIRWRFTF